LTAQAHPPWRVGFHNHKMLYPLLRPFLFHLDSERAHDLALAAARRFADYPTACRWLRTLTAHHAPVTVAGLTFPNRVGLAAGMDKNGVAVRAWWAAGFGFVELGTVTPQPQPGNKKPRMFREPRDHAVVNRMGFNNHGAAALVERLARLQPRPPIPIGISVGKNATTPLERAADDYESAAAVVASHADFVAINVSSPNTTGLRSLQTGDTVGELVRRVRTVIGVKPLFVKVAPELTGGDLAGVVDSALSHGAAGIIATNTLGCRAPTGLPAGRSGRPLREIAARRVGEVRKLAGRSAVIGVGGIETAASARRMVEAGADLIQVYTGLVYRGPFLAASLARVL
jgi:dihydroorotate dehydrogenase